MKDTSKTYLGMFKTQGSRNPYVAPTGQHSFRKHARKSVKPVKHISSSICKNAACQAPMSTHDAFCKRCSCCICKLFDDNKDPSLWLACGFEYGDEDSCGLSCHLECAFQRGRVGDGSYWCAACGKVSLILECWKKQLIIAKDARFVDAFCEKIVLCNRLLEGTQKFQGLHEIIQDITAKLVTELGPLNKVSGKTSGRGLVSRLSGEGEVLKLCALAIEKVDKWLAPLPIINLNHIDSKAPQGQQSLSSHEILELDLNVVPDLNEEITPSLDEEYRPLLCPIIKPNYDSAAHDSIKVGAKSNGSGVSANKGEMPIINLEFSCDDCVKVLGRLQYEGHIKAEFWEKFLAWFAWRSTEHEKRVVKTFIQCLIDDSSSLAAQLFDTFSEIIVRQ